MFLGRFGLALNVFAQPVHIGLQGKVTFNHVPGYPFLQKFSDFNGEIGDIVFICPHHFFYKTVQLFDQGPMFFLVVFTKGIPPKFFTASYGHQS